MPTQLAALQCWMREVITHPDGVAAGARTDLARSQLVPEPDRFDQVVTRSSTLTARQRMEIYQHGYFRRLLDCLAEMLPVLRHALGNDLFTRFALEYLQHHPSRSYTLAQLDEGFVAYLRANRPDRDLPEADREDWPDFMIDLATLERGIRTTFDGPGVEGEAMLDPTTVAGWTDEQMMGAVLAPAPCLRLMSFRFPVRDYLLAVRSGADPALPAPRDTHVAFNRRDFGVRLLEFERLPHDLLTNLAAGDRVATAGQRVGLTRPGAIRPWLLRYAEAALFRDPHDHSTAVRVDASEGAHR